MNIINQYRELLNENIHANAVKKVAKYLKQYYEPVDADFPIGNEFINKLMFKKLGDDGLITKEELLSYLKSKFNNYSDKFIDQVITDWVNGDITYDYTLSKNVPM